MKPEPPDPASLARSDSVSMYLPNDIDITFDFRSDTPSGRDPDTFSPTLRRYHKILWSKLLPNGMSFDLHDAAPSAYLRHRSALGEFLLSSDGAITTFCNERRLAVMLAQVSVDEREAFERLRNTIGARIVFPGNRLDRKMTINGARGCHPRIKDRFDLTLECIRRHYRDERSPYVTRLRGTQTSSPSLGIFGDTLHTFYYKTSLPTIVLL